jgi:hypothetical protein
MDSIECTDLNEGLGFGRKCRRHSENSPPLPGDRVSHAAEKEAPKEMLPVNAPVELTIVELTINEDKMKFKGERQELQDAEEIIPRATRRGEPRHFGRIPYGQRLAVSSHPAARTGCGAGIDGAAGTERRAVAWGPFTAVAKAGFPISDPISFSSESSGATSRRASTSFSSRVNSISFCRNTS